jgi:hypothetical protein
VVTSEDKRISHEKPQHVHRVPATRLDGHKKFLSDRSEKVSEEDESPAISIGVIPSTREAENESAELAYNEASILAEAKNRAIRSS